MLVISRHRDEIAVVDLRKHGLGLGKITVVDIRGDKVRLGLDFDGDVPVHRQEIFDAIERENALKQACQPSGAIQGENPPPTNGITAPVAGLVGKESAA